jgi:HK97 family phage major capsid protein
VKISNELIADSAENAQAAGLVGDRLVRQFARTVDLAFFGNTATLGPSGLESIDYQLLTSGVSSPTSTRSLTPSAPSSVSAAWSHPSPRHSKPSTT